MAESARFQSTGAKIGSLVAFCLFVFWGGWRWFIASGGPWHVGHSCGSLVACMDGLCLVHERAQAGGELLRTEGYCSKRCKVDNDCRQEAKKEGEVVPGMTCEALPVEMSRKNGDHLPVIQLPERICIRIKAH